jgi:aryl-alcohol dehydrogenase-like predicted oxidoreductase
MKVAYDAGVNFFDTAEGYSGGQSEIVLGQAIKKFGWKQNDLVISTKVNTQIPTSTAQNQNKSLITHRSTGVKPTAPTRISPSTTPASLVNT